MNILTATHFFNNDNTIINNMVIDQGLIKDFKFVEEGDLNKIVDECSENESGAF